MGVNRKWSEISMGVMWGVWVSTGSGLGVMWGMGGGGGVWVLTKSGLKLVWSHVGGVGVNQKWCEISLGVMLGM